MDQYSAIQTANGIKSQFMNWEILSNGFQNGLAPREAVVTALKAIDPTVDLGILMRGFEHWSGLSSDATMIDYCLFFDWVFGVDMRVFASHQHTVEANAQIASWMKGFGEESGMIKASVPPFNVRLCDQPLEGMVGFNLPCYGVRLPRAVMRVFETEGLQQLAKEMGIPLPYYAMDTFVQKKMKKVLDLADVASQRTDCMDGPNQLAVQKLRAFATEFKDLNSIKSPEDFSAFVERHVPAGWEDRLHFDHLLTSNFGFEEHTANELRHTVFEFDDNGERKAEKLESYSLRWLSKAFKGWAPVGCLTDFVNLIFAMSSPDSPGAVDENAITEVVEQFKLKIDAGDFMSLWIPTHYIHDAEADDALSWLLLEYVHRMQSSKLYVLMQLPEDHTFDLLERKAQGLPGGRYRVFRDKDSGNGKAVAQAWAHVLNEKQ